MPIDLPPATLDHIEGAPLKVALVQARFAPVHAIEKRERVADFQDRLGDTYLAREALVPQTISIQVGGSGAAPPPPVPTETIWPFQDDERGWAVALASSSVALEAKTYDDFDDFLGEWRSVLDALSETFAPKQRVRLGLRYVNELFDSRLQDPGGLTAILRPELVSPVGTELGSDLAGSFSELRFREPEGTFVLRHGLTSREAYLLDFDYFNEEAAAFDAETIVSATAAFHAVIEPLFVWCLQPSYLDELKGRARGD